MLEPKVLWGNTPVGSKQKILRSVIEFVFSNLAAWRDDLTRSAETAETRLNAQLSTYLDKVARRKGFPVLFQREAPQVGHRHIDIVANPDEKLVAHGYYNTCYDEVVVFEAKRLPAPALRRQREYVTGGINEMSGGIQRFKAGVHGEKHEVAVMIGYIQSGTPHHHFRQINNWIFDLCERQKDSVVWTREELLRDFIEKPDRTSKAISVHSRMKQMDIVLHHLWVVM